MKFSVIIPTYNRADLLDKCLESLVEQTFKDFEVLVCDDGSTDNSKEIADKYKESLDIHYIWNENWGGPARPRNIGIRAAKGEWLCFLDSDDWWTNNKLELCLPYLEHNDILYHNLYLYDQNKGLIADNFIRCRQPQTPVYEDLLLNMNCCTNSSVVLRKSVVEQVGFFTEDKALIAVEDFDYWLRVSQATERFCHIDELLGYYWVGDTSISASEKWFARHDALYNKHLKNVKSPKVAKKIRATQAYRTARNYHAVYNRDKDAIKHYIVALKTGNFTLKIKSLIILPIAMIMSLIKRK